MTNRLADTQNRQEKPGGFVRKKALNRAMMLIGLLCCSIYQTAWASDEDWVKRAEELQDKTMWGEVSLFLALEAHELGAFQAGGHFGDRLIESDLVSYSAVGLLAASVIIPLSHRESLKEMRELRKREEKGFWKGVKEDFRRINLLRKRVTAPHDLKGIFIIQPCGAGVGVVAPAKLVDVTIERINTAGISPHSPLDTYLDQIDGSIGMRYGFAKNILVGADAGVSGSDISFLKIINPDGSTLGYMRYRIRAFYIDGMAEWRVPIDLKKFNFFIGAGPTYSEVAFTEAFSWRGNTTWRGSAFGGKAGVRAEWYMFRHSSISLNLVERFSRIRQIKTGAGDVLRNNAGETVPVDLTSISFTMGVNYRF